MNYTQEVCQSCYRVVHYGDYKKINQMGNYDDFVLNILREKEALFIWVVDLFHLDESMPDVFVRNLQGKDVCLVLNKRDIFPDDIKDGKLLQRVMKSQQLSGIHLKGVCFLGKFGKDGLDGLYELCDQHRHDRDIYVIGCVNVGKSTLINELSKSSHLTSSPIPSTTVGAIPVETQMGVIYDTPGFVGGASLLDALPLNQIKLLQPTKTLKPLVFQLHGDQSLLIGGIGVISVEGAQNLTMVCYLPTALNVMRIKNESLSKHKPRRVLEEKITLGSLDWSLKSWSLPKKTDLVIGSIGFVSVSGQCKRLTSQFDRRVDVFKREALI